MSSILTARTSLRAWPCRESWYTLRVQTAWLCEFESRRSHHRARSPTGRGAALRWLRLSVRIAPRAPVSDAEPGGLPAPLGRRLAPVRACRSVLPASSGWLTGTAPGAGLKPVGAARHGHRQHQPPASFWRANRTGAPAPVRSGLGAERLCGSGPAALRQFKGSQRARQHGLPAKECAPQGVGFDYLAARHLTANWHPIGIQLPSAARWSCTALVRRGSRVSTGRGLHAEGKSAASGSLSVKQVLSGSGAAPHLRTIHASVIQW